MKRNLVLLSLLVLVSAASASATVTYQVTTVPTFVIATGRSEVLGSVRITSTNAGPSVASTIQFLYQAVACDNDFASGVTITTSGIFAVAGNVTAGSVTNTAAGCTVNITVAGALVPAPGDFIEVGGARGRIDLVAGVAIGGNLSVALNASPSNSSLFTSPAGGVVATLEPGLGSTITAGSQLLCLGGFSVTPSITVKEGFNSAFVQHVATALGSGTPLNARPTFGGTKNTQINIQIVGLPTGITLTFPTTTNSALNGGVFVAGVAGSQLQLISASGAIAGGGAGSVASLTYEYACGNQAVCDVNPETFTLIPTIAVAAGATAGSATAQIHLFPPLISGDAVLATDSPLPAAPKPRFNDPLQPSPAGTFLTVAPCTTNLLFTFTANTSGFDTGIAIANTSSDPYAAAVSAPKQAGTCTLNGFPKGGGAAVAFTTASIASGTTFTTTLSNSANPAFNGFIGYIIAVCNFQYGHGFAFLTNNFGVGPPTVAQGYIAQVIPDPVILGGRFANFSPAGIVSGERLDQ